MMKCEKGFSLLELSVSLMVIGLMVGGIVTLMHKAGESLSGSSSSAMLLRMDDALLGFITSNGRLPCPDNGTGAGSETCGVSVGALPWRTLGLAAPVLNASGLALRYAVYRNASATASLDSDLAVTPVPDRFFPILPIAPATAASTAPAVATAAGTTTNLNGLDFCIALRNAIQAPLSIALNVSDGAGGVINVAYLLADPGRGDADGVAGGDLFDALNAGMDVNFDQMERAISATYDDRIHAVAFTTLASRLRCASAIGEVNGKARAAMAAADARAVANAYHLFIAFVKQIADMRFALAQFFTTGGATLSAGALAAATTAQTTAVSNLTSASDRATAAQTEATTRLAEANSADANGLLQ